MIEVIAIKDMISANENGDVVKKYPKFSKVGTFSGNPGNGMLKVNGNEFVQEKNVAVIMKPDSSIEKSPGVSPSGPKSMKSGIGGSIHKSIAIAMIVAAIILFSIGKKGIGIGVGIAGLIIIKPLIFKK